MIFYPFHPDIHVWQIFCFALSADDGSTYRKKIASECEHFIDLTPFSVFQMSKRIHDEQLHILINLNGYTEGGHNELYVSQLAPVQAMLMGFSGSMAAPSWMPYLVWRIYRLPS